MQRISTIIKTHSFAQSCETVLLFAERCDKICEIGALNLKGEVNLTISYNRLWKLLVDKKMSKADLRKIAGIAPNTMTKLRRDREVTLAVLGRICDVLNVNIGDVMEFLPEISPNDNSGNYDAEK